LKEEWPEPMLAGNADPYDSVEQRLKERLSGQGARIMFGSNRRVDY